MNSWEELDAAFGGAGNKPGDWDALDKAFKSAASATAPTKQKAPLPDFRGTLNIGPIDTGIPLPEWFNKGLVQTGSGIADWVLGAKQMLASNKPTGVKDLVTGQTEADRLRMQADEKKAFDARLNSDITGKVLNFAGKVLPAFAIPQFASAPILSGFGAGAVAGAFEPTGTGDSRLANTVLGGALGGVLPAAVGGVRNLLKPDAATLAAAQKANQYGIPLGPADLSTNRMVRAAQSVTNDIPIAGMPGASLREQQQQAFNKAVGGQFGAAEAKLTPDVVDAAKKRMGAEFDRIWNNNSLTVDNQMFTAMQDLRTAAQSLPAGQRANVISKIDDLWSRAVPGANGAPTIPGQTANQFQQFLREQARPNSPLEYEFSTLRRAVIDGFNRSIGPADAAALTANRSQYKAFKTVEPLLDKGAVGTAGRGQGDIPASLLSEAVRRNYPGLSSQVNAPPLAELASLGSRFLADRTAQTGGSPRAALQNMGLLSSLLTTVGGAGPANMLLNSKTLGQSVMNGGQASRRLLGPSSQLLAGKEAAALGLQRLPLGLLSMFGLPAPEQQAF